jgi:hypothetical protein
MAHLDHRNPGAVEGSHDRVDLVGREAVADAVRPVPEGRIGDPHASFVSGAEIVVDGALSCG